MVLAFGADVEIGFEIFLPDDGAAAGALGPQAFGFHRALIGGDGVIDRFFFALEPGHLVFAALRIELGQKQSGLARAGVED
jgi:hypothetical protein